VGYYYDLRNAKIVSLETDGNADALVEKITIMFGSLDTIYFDATGNTSKTTSASWSLPKKEIPEAPAPRPTPTTQNSVPFDFLGLFSPRQSPKATPQAEPNDDSNDTKKKKKRWVETGIRLS